MNELYFFLFLSLKLIVKREINFNSPYSYLSFILIIDSSCSKNVLGVIDNFIKHYQNKFAYGSEIINLEEFI